MSPRLEPGTRDRRPGAWSILACCALGYALLGGVAAAQTAAPAGPPVRFTVFSARPINDLAFLPVVGAAPQKLVFYPTARSPRFEYRGPMPLRFVDAGSGAVVAEAKIPPDIREPFLLFSPATGSAASGGLRYQIAVLDDSHVRHGRGGLAIINLSGMPLSGSVNRETVTLRAGLNPTFAVGRSAKVALRTTFNGRSYTSYTGEFRLAPNERALLILFPPYYKGSLEVQSRLLVDRPEIIAAQKPN
jgi:hypothetical protein